AGIVSTCTRPSPMQSGTRARHSPSALSGSLGWLRPSLAPKLDRYGDGGFAPLGQRLFGCGVLVEQQAASERVFGRIRDDASAGFEGEIADTQSGFWLLAEVAQPICPACVVHGVAVHQVSGVAFEREPDLDFVRTAGDAAGGCEV